MQFIITMLFLAVAVAYVLYTAYRILTGRATGCSSCHSEECHHDKNNPSN